MNSSFGISNLFITKDVKISINNKDSFILCVPTLEDFYTSDEINAVYHLISSDNDDFVGTNKAFLTNFSFIKAIVFDLGIYDKFWTFRQALERVLQQWIKGFCLDKKNKEFKIDNLIITEEIWEYIIYILKLSCGEKVSLPPTFGSEEERRFYLAQKEYEKKIAKIREKNKKEKGASDQLAKTLLSITYAFPSFTFDYLIKQTMAQIQWLQKYAAESMSYEVNAQAFAAGNMKKGKKLDFFIK